MRCAVGGALFIAACTQPPLQEISGEPATSDDLAEHLVSSRRADAHWMLMLVVPGVAVAGFHAIKPQRWSAAGHARRDRRPRHLRLRDDVQYLEREPDELVQREMREKFAGVICGVLACSVAIGQLRRRR
jgi:hypothetical protein